jgi:hypothetical protein
MRAICLIVVVACGGAAPPPVANSPTTPAKAPPPPAKDDSDELLHGHPTADSFAAFVAQFPSLSAARRSTIAALGTTRDAPIHIPAIDDEYVWVAKIACNGGAGKVTMQALVGGLDALSFTCPDDTAEHTTYFDFSDDPQEKAMQKELGGT